MVTSFPDAWSRVVISSVEPQVKGGAYPIKRSVGEAVEVAAGVITDGHEVLAVELYYGHEEDREERVVRMPLRYNDEYVATFPVEKLGRYRYRVRAWLDRFATWQDQFRRRVEGGEPEQELKSELQEGTAFLRRATENAEGGDARLLEAHVAALESGDTTLALQDEVAELARRHAPREGAVESQALEVAVDPKRAIFAAWYEFFPRSTRTDGKHGTLDDAAERLTRIKDLGFDVAYLPPVHPIGTTHRKGKDNAPTAGPDDPGSPWAIGGPLGDGTMGGHKSVHPDLGGLDAFDRFVEQAEALDLKVALDIAFQTSPDHPYVEAHPEWFYHRPDGSIRYAENPPKKYQDVYPIKFEGEAAPALWQELKSVFQFWIDHGVTIFRVDNPHTKPFAFWEWCLDELRTEHPELIFLAEAFTRPKIMHELARIGFNNSYTYFAWRNTKEELTEYGRELFQTEVAEFFRPNFWPNTPDILTDYLVNGGRPAHVVRFVLAATMSPAYGVYGPPFEHVDNRQHPKREEYAGNEKYEIRSWNWNDPHSLQPLMRRVNRIRRENPALQRMRGLRFHPISHRQLLAYSRRTGNNVILVAVNLDPHQAHDGWVELPLEELHLPADRPYEVHDLLQGEHYTWQGAANYIRLDPHVMPAHIFRLQTRVRTEEDYDNIVN